MLTAYLDESGIHAGSRICAIAGFVGTDEQWDIFERRWKQAIRAEGITQFHMAEFESRLNEFSGWSNTRRRNFLATLIGIIAARHLYAVGSGLSLEDYNRLAEPDKAWMTHGNPDQPYFLCFQHGIVESAHRADGLDAHERVAGTDERGRDGQAHGPMKKERLQLEAAVHRICINGVAGLSH